MSRRHFPAAYIAKVKRLLRWLACLAIALMLGIGGLLALLSSKQASLIYFPRPYAASEVSRWDNQPGTTVIPYQTSSGDQQAYLLSTSNNPQRLWFVCGGNGTIALEWSDWFRKNASPDDVYLFFDMPGYGACSGKPSPASIKASIKSVIPAAAHALGWTLEPSDPRLRFFGHSLGAAVSLEAAREFDIRRGVILTPFTSTMDMAREMTGLPVAFLVKHRFDNTARLKEMAKHGNAEVFLIHGSNDEAIPVEMSRTLAREVPEVVRYTEIPKGMHNDLQDIASEVLIKAMFEARQ